MSATSNSQQGTLAAPRWSTLSHIAAAFVVGFVGFIWGGMAVSHECLKDIPLAKVSIHIFSTIGSGYLWYKVPRWYYRIPAVAVVFGIVWWAGIIYLREVHK